MFYAASSVIYGMFFFYLCYFPYLAAQPRTILANCHLNEEEAFHLIYISSELDLYKLESFKNKMINKQSFWFQFMEQSFIHDYSYKFGEEVKTESNKGYFIKFNTLAPQKIIMSIHKNKGLKSAIRRIMCLKIT